MKVLIVLPLFFLLTACTLVSVYEQTADDYALAAPNIELGMARERVIAILNPSQRRLSSTEIKQADKYTKDGVSVEILYFRSGWQSDGFTTDDEFTPYIFNAGKLVAIGWTTLDDA